MKQTVQDYLAYADVQINGSRPWDIQVNNAEFYARVLAGGSIALGESYMDGWWDCKALDQFFHKILDAELDGKVRRSSLLFTALKSRLINMQSRLRLKELVHKHYDLSTDLYMSFLDPYNQYTCGYFKNTDDLNKAQEQKIRLICEKLRLSSNDKVLDIGCGWGGFAKYAAEEYSCHVTGITISDVQMKYARKFCEGIPVTIVKSDYRDFKGTFDKILICGMIEHVGYKNYKTLMKMVHGCLEWGGLFLLHTIGGSTSERYGDPWMSKYIFHNSMIPSSKQITTSAEGLFVIEDWHTFGMYYDNTIMAWYRNFINNWDNIKSEYDERFYRMWTYYLLSSAGSFRSRRNSVWQIVFSINGVKGGYHSVR